MDISARTLREVEFREKLRGYHPDDVDEFLERVAIAIEQLHDRLREATERANRLQQQQAVTPPPAPPQESVVAAPVVEGDSIKHALALAQRTADVTIQEAREQATQLVQHAQAEANRVLAAAKERADAIVQAGQAQVRGDVVRLEAAREQATADFRKLAEFLEQERVRLHHALNQAIAQLDQAVPGAAPPPPFPPLDLPPSGLATSPVGTTDS